MKVFSPWVFFPWPVYHGTNIFACCSEQSMILPYWLHHVLYISPQLIAALSFSYICHNLWVYCFLLCSFFTTTCFWDEYHIL